MADSESSSDGNCSPMYINLNFEREKGIKWKQRT